MQQLFERGSKRLYLTHVGYLSGVFSASPNWPVGLLAD